jgi:hypothetical protein
VAQLRLKKRTSSHQQAHGLRLQVSPAWTFYSSVVAAVEVEQLAQTTLAAVAVVVLFSSRH